MTGHNRLRLRTIFGVLAAVSVVGLLLIQSSPKNGWYSSLLKGSEDVSYVTSTQFDEFTRRIRKDYASRVELDDLVTKRIKAEFVSKAELEALLRKTRIEAENAARAELKKEIAALSQVRDSSYVSKTELKDLLSKYAIASEVEAMIKRSSPSKQASGSIDDTASSAGPPQPICRLRDFSQGVFVTSKATNKTRFESICPLRFVPTLQCLGKSRVVLIGDSTMIRLSWALSEAMRDLYIIGDSQSLFDQSAAVSTSSSPITTKIVKQGSKCDEDRLYFNFSQSLTMKPSCKMCNGCISRLEQFSSGGTMEYLAIERVFDEQMPSALYNSTQENIIDYLASSSVDLVVVNAGAHHVLYQKPEQVKAMFREKLIWYLQLMRRRLPNTQIVWLATSLIVHNNTWMNEVAIWMNEVAQHVTNQNGIPYLDAYNISVGLEKTLVKARHDSIHFVHAYYQTIRDILVSWFCSESRGF